MQPIKVLIAGQQKGLGYGSGGRNPHIVLGDISEPVQEHLKLGITFQDVLAPDVHHYKFPKEVHQSSGLGGLRTCVCLESFGSRVKLGDWSGSDRRLPVRIRKEIPYVVHLATGEHTLRGRTNKRTGLSWSCLELALLLRAPGFILKVESSSQKARNPATDNVKGLSEWVVLHIRPGISSRD